MRCSVRASQNVRVRIANSGQQGHLVNAINGVANKLPILRNTCHLDYCGFVIRPT